MPNNVMSSQDMARAITRIAHEIIERNQGIDNLMLVGIRTRGIYLAERLQKKISEIEAQEPGMGVLDITFYRDDFGKGKQNPVIKKTEIPISIEGKTVVLCDDVLYTGRTIRAAIDALMDFGRPSCVQLAVLVDRGHRELPIRPDFIGKNVPTSREMIVKVKFAEVDGEDIVKIQNRSDSA